MALLGLPPRTFLHYQAPEAGAVVNSFYWQSSAVGYTARQCDCVEGIDRQGWKSCLTCQICRSAASSVQILIGSKMRAPRLRKSVHGRRQKIVSEIGGQYEDTFYDVEKHMLNSFTFKAVRTVLGQLQETNPPQYTYLYNFVVNNKPQDGKFFIQALLKDRQELGERVLVQRLHLFNRWAKRYKHEDMYKIMSDQNLELLRERLIQTVKFADSEDAEHSSSP